MPWCVEHGSKMGAVYTDADADAEEVDAEEAWTHPSIAQDSNTMDNFLGLAHTDEASRHIPLKMEAEIH